MDNKIPNAIQSVKECTSRQTILIDRLTSHELPVADQQRNLSNCGKINALLSIIRERSGSKTVNNLILLYKSVIHLGMND